MTVVTGRDQARDEMASDEAAGTCDEDRGHGWWPFGCGGADAGRLDRDRAGIVASTA